MQSINTFMEELTVSSHFVKAALRGAEQRGFDPKVMEQAGISKTCTTRIGTGHRPPVYKADADHLARPQ